MWIPVILTLILGPGMGQIYNKEYKKGAYLIVTSLIVLVAMLYWMKNLLLPYLPTDVTTEDPLALAQSLQDSMHKETTAHAGAYYGYLFLLGGLWAYSVYDAYKGGKRRAQEKLQKLQQLAGKK